MSLHAHDFVLLPPPSRSLLSYVAQNKRDVLPDFASVEELQTFVTRFFYYDFRFVPAIYVQMKISTSFLCVVVVLAVLVVMRRMYERTFWIIRIVRRPSGRVLVPNSLLCFAIIEGVYALGCVALVWVIVYTHEYHVVRPFFSPIWITLPWCPLYLGATWATWGTFFATPSQLRRTAHPGPKSLFRRFLHNALVTNVAGILAPIVVCISIFALSVVSAVYFKRAQRQHDRWLRTYGNSTSFTQSMVIDAQLIWFEMLKSNRFLSITMILWAGWTLVLWVAYNIASLRLIRVIRRELKKSSAESMSPVRFGISTQVHAETAKQLDPTSSATTTATTTNEALNHMPSLATLREASRRDGIHVLTATPATHPYAFAMPSLPPNKAQITQAVDEDDDAIDVDNLARREMETSFIHRLRNVDGELAGVQNVKSAPERGHGSAFKSPHLPHVVPLNLSTHQKKWTANDIRRNWRHYMPNIVMQTGEQSEQESVHVAREVHVKQIRKAYRHICVQYLAICPGMFTFMLIAASMGALLFGAAELPYRGGTMFEPVLAVGITAAFWLNVVAGMCIFVALALRTYEPVFSNVQLSVSHARQNSGNSARATADVVRHATDYAAVDHVILAGDKQDYADNFLHLVSVSELPRKR